jgi:DNA-binding CsgD family transcriptional regulator
MDERFDRADSLIVPPVRLTERQLEVLRLGLRDLFDKLVARNRVELVELASRMGL